MFIFNDSDPINIIDSLQVSITQGFAVMRAAAAAAAGKNLHEVSNIVQETCNRATMFGLIDTVDYLVKGGRLSKTAGLIGSLLNIKPIIVTRNGEVVQYAKTRSFTKSLRSIRSKLESDSDLEEIGIMYTTDPIIANEFADSISDLLPNGKKPYISQLDDRIKQAVLDYMDSFTEQQLKSRPMEWWYRRIKEYVFKALALKNEKKIRKKIKIFWLEELIKLEKAWKFKKKIK